MTALRLVSVADVSYDIYFVRRDPGQSFEDALDETEEAFQGDPGPLRDVELENWETILPLARQILGEVEEFDDEATRELTHPPTGIQLSVFNGEVAIRVPYGEFGESSVEVMSKAYALAREIERATGLEGYDPQLEEPVSERPEGGVAVRRPARGWDEDDDDPGGLDGTSATPPESRPHPPESLPTQRPRWWEFWKS